MAREPRIFVERACYHIMVRGNQKQAVFKDRGDYDVYLYMLKNIKIRKKILLYAYCIMPNHVHLLIEPSSLNSMSRFMHWLNRGYAAYFNTKYKTVGHLWQGRFKSKPIVKDSYLLNCATYMENNPIRANLASNVTEYPWTSYNERCLASKKTLLDEIRFEH